MLGFHLARQGTICILSLLPVHPTVLSTIALSLTGSLGPISSHEPSDSTLHEHCLSLLPVVVRKDTNRICNDSKVCVNRSM